MRDAIIVVGAEKGPLTEHIVWPVQFLVAGGPALVLVSRWPDTDLHPKIKKLANYIISVTNPSSLSAFEGGTLRPILALEDLLREDEIKRVTICGVVDGPALVCTALDAAALGFDTKVSKGATHFAEARPLDTALHHFARAGVTYG